jgi:hypothetical protein
MVRLLVVARGVCAAALLACVLTLGVSSGEAQAQEPYPPCDAGQVPAKQFQGLPASLVWGRAAEFNVTDTEREDSYMRSAYAVNVVMTDAQGQQFFAANDVYDWQPLQIRSDPGDGPLTVAATFTEFTSSYRNTSACTRTITKTMPSIAGATIPAPAVSAKYEQADFDLRQPSGCQQKNAPSPIAVLVKPSGARSWTRMVASDQCAGWDQESKQGPGFRLVRDEIDVDDDDVLTFQPRTAARDSVKFFRFRVVALRADGPELVDGRVLRSGTLRVRTSYEPAVRVYATRKDGSINDRYWNYCVNEGKQTWMSNGNAYCIEPSSTYRAVSLR